MSELKAYVNKDSISSYLNVEGQVEIYELDDTNSDIVAVEYESYETEEQMQARVDQINNGHFTWKTL